MVVELARKVRKVHKDQSVPKVQRAIEAKLARKVFKV